MFNIFSFNSKHNKIGKKISKCLFPSNKHNFKFVFISSWTKLSLRVTGRTRQRVYCYAMGTDKNSNSTSDNTQKITDKQTKARIDIWPLHLKSKHHIDPISATGSSLERTLPASPSHLISSPFSTAPNTVAQHTLSLPETSNPSSMADEHKRREHLPTVLVLGSPTCFSALESNFSHKFNFLVNNSRSSPIPLQEFMIANRHDASSIRALLCSANCPINADVLRLLPSLGVVVTTSAGTDHIDLAECRRRGIRVAGAGDVLSEDVADMTVGLLIDVMRRISAADRYVRSQSGCGQWDFPLGSKV